MFVAISLSSVLLPLDLEWLQTQAQQRDGIFTNKTKSYMNTSSPMKHCRISVQICYEPLSWHR
jgi:hypothetical protein